MISLYKVPAAFAQQAVDSCRCVTSTGHVTTGGSICLEALTCSGTPGSWQPGSSVESAINTIMINMVRAGAASPMLQPLAHWGPLLLGFQNGFENLAGFILAKSAWTRAGPAQQMRRAWSIPALPQPVGNMLQAVAGQAGRHRPALAFQDRAGSPMGLAAAFKILAWHKPC